MTRAQYRKLRQSIGSQPEVAKLLGVHPITISKRERGEIAINKEAVIALRALRVKGKS
jgi:DNA-binding transcriptional regulator YiaG